MRHSRWLFLGVLVLVTVLAATLPAGAATSRSAPQYFVRIASDDVLAAAALNLSPSLALDYGSYQWLVLDEASLARLEASGVAYTPFATAGQVRVTRYTFDPLVEGEPALPNHLRASGNGDGFRLVQFAGPTVDSWLDTLRSSGVKVLQYYPHNTYLVWGTASQLAATEALSFVRWQGAFHPAYKINSDLDNRSGRINNVDIMFYNDGNIQGTLNSLTAMGINILQYFPSQPDKAFYDVIVEMDARAIDAVAQLSTVLWLGYMSPEPVLDDEMSSQIQAGNYTAGVPFTGYQAQLNDLGVDGTGVIWAVVDTGVDYNHPDLNTHIVGGYSFPGACNTNPGEDCSGGGHGTHVAGIIGGDAAAGFTDAGGFFYGLGVAPEYSIFAMNSLSAAAWPPAGGWQEHSKQAVLGNAVGGNNSWTTGEGTNHGYQASERTHDLMVRDGNFDTTTVAEPFIEVFSAGNSGPSTGTLTAPKEAKNLIITASSQNYRAGSIDVISSFSSRGPAVDGRWVPTITAPGEDIASTRNDLGGDCSTAIAGTNNYYAFCSGTSMASPHAAGAVVLTTEWWRTFNAGANPSPAMAKALLVNGAVDMGTADIPNIHEGWGRVNITNIISPSVPVIYYDQTHTFAASGQQWQLAFGVADPSQPLKITIAWSDAPGAVGANPALVNNLNLTVINGANTYLGNRFVSGWSATGGTVDNLNNLENVYIQNPDPSATIIIDAFAINGDGIPYNADTTDQDFALVCYNCVLSPDFTLQATPPSQDVCAPNNAVYAVNAGSLLGYNDPVSLSASGNPAGTTAVFSINPVTPPNSSNLTIGNTGAAAAGNYTISIVGVAPTSTHTTTVQLNLFTGAPGAATLLNPANGATGVSLTPNLTWTAVANSSDYDIEIATDMAFTNIVYTATATTNAHSVGTALNLLTTYYWRVRASNICGNGSYSAVFSFTTRDIPDILLVDDDDNAPDTRATYTAALGVLGLDYDVWDTANSNNEPTIANLAPYKMVIWFSGDEFGGFAGPGATGETALATWLDAGNCLFLSGQDYLYDRLGSGGTTPNSFMSTYLGLATLSHDNGDYTSVTGAGSVFGALGSMPLSYTPLSDYSDRITPNGTAEVAMVGNNTYNGAINRDSGVYKTTFWAFPWEAIANAANREAALGTFLNTCSSTFSVTPISTANVPPGTTVVHEFVLANLNVTNSYTLTLTPGNWTTTLLTPSPINVTGGSTATIQVQVQVPTTITPPSQMDEFFLTVQSANDPAEVEIVSGETQSSPYQATLTAMSHIITTPGTVVTHTFTLENLNWDDSYMLAVSDNTWTTTIVNSSPVTVDNGNSVVIQVRVVVPASTTPISDSFTLTATSVNAPTLILTGAGMTDAEVGPGDFFLPIMHNGS
ncbi:MAG: S8 family serine peptidase [Candidatus Promineifilaceae bacterium]